MMFYILISIRPPARASKWVIREYCLFSIIYLAFIFIYGELFRHNKLKAGMDFVLLTAMWVSLYPVFIYRVIHADTEYWRGMGQKACDLQRLLCQKKRMNERISSEGLHLLIEMHRNYIIDFAYLDFDTPIGTGATAIVFKGLLHSKIPVAVKVYTPEEVTEEIIGEFSNEAALCGALQHPNIVTFNGMCVAPPNICLVSELCVASLEDMLDTTGHVEASEPIVQISYILDAARAVAYLHSFSPPFIHRDIKPSNFLVDYDGVVKLTDFGESRKLPRANSNSVEGGVVDDVKDEVKISVSEECNEQRPKRTISKKKCMTVRGTIDYMAPELLTGRGGRATYSEGVDIYSLAITMWEILYPKQKKHPPGMSYFSVYQWVLDGNRPPLDDNLTPRLKSLIQRSWSHDVSLRPPASEVVSILEEIQEEMLSIVTSRLQGEMKLHTKKSWRGKILSKIFIGHEAVNHMMEEGFVNCRSEAIRLGNAMMDAGFMHHAKHQRPFEDSSAMFFFDDLKVNDSLPLDDTASHDSTRRDSHSSVAYSEAMYSAEDCRNCSCQKQAQGFDRPKGLKSKHNKKSQMLRDNFLTAKLLPKKENSPEFDDF